MGIILDSSIIIDAERTGEPPSKLIARLALRFNDQPMAQSAIGYTELAFAQHRGSDQRRQLSRHFLDDLSKWVPVYPYTAKTASIAARLNAEQKSMGLSIPFTDLLIASSALEFDYSILTLNLRHFRLIPSLHVLTL